MSFEKVSDQMKKNLECKHRGSLAPGLPARKGMSTESGGAAVAALA
jgi:hypothetical protein